MHKGFYNRIYRDPNTGAGGGASGGAAGNQGTGQQQQQQEVKPPTGIDRFANIWDPPKAKETPPNNNNNNNNNNQPQQQQTPGDNPTKTYLSKQNYMDGVDMAPIAESFKNGDANAFMTHMNEIMRNMHGKMLGDMATIAEHHRDKAVETATGKAANDYRVNQVYEQMFTKHPALKMPQFKKVASDLLAQGMRNGKDVDTAIQDTYDYFIESGKFFNKAPSNPNSHGGPGMQSWGDDGDSAPKLDVDALFTGKPSE